MVTFKEAIQLFFTRYTDFKGRSSRSEYWWVQLLHIAVVFGMSFPIGMVAGLDPDFSSGVSIVLMVILCSALGIYLMAVIIPGIALSVRRLHDINQTGWIALVLGVLGVIPIIGYLVMIAQIIIGATPGTVGDNKYGPDPKDRRFGSLLHAFA